MPPILGYLVFCFDAEGFLGYCITVAGECIYGRGGGGGYGILTVELRRDLDCGTAALEVFLIIN